MGIRQKLRDQAKRQDQPVEDRRTYEPPKAEKVTEADEPTGAGTEDYIVPGEPIEA